MCCRHGLCDDFGVRLLSSALAPFRCALGKVGGWCCGAAEKSGKDNPDDEAAALFDDGDNASDASVGLCRCKRSSGSVRRRL